MIAALESPGHAGTPTCRHKSNNKSGSVQGGNCSSGGGDGGGGGLWATTLTQTVLLSGKNLAGEFVHSSRIQPINYFNTGIESLNGFGRSTHAQAVAREVVWKELAGAPEG